ncbi:hypothetical protein PHYBOEH_002090 [Phytophthora boehmeriae]|uniref:Uncharacterized protein n=1 Tax=Phytophthora boehmeriae TaxID=109152 RepID=A0A8T1X692_9STRA|nr:hypothetical protein PHYBOEH_002090 [Phytophthora boehmeriae]
MGQPTEEPSTALSSSPLGWDGKCGKCRKLMSRCMCFQGLEGDEGPLKTSPTPENVVDASETRPLWNALRKMHRKSSAASHMLLPRKGSNSSAREQRKRSEALPPLSAPSSSGSRHHRRSDARPPTARRSSREPMAEPSPERPSSHSRKDRLQRAGITGSSSPNFKKEAAVIRSTSRMSMEKQSSSHPKENFIDGGRFSEDDNETVWEL